jgi:hypothetical protein
MAHATSAPTYSVAAPPVTATVTECHAAAATAAPLVHFSTAASVEEQVRSYLAHVLQLS